MAWKTAVPSTSLLEFSLVSSVLMSQWTSVRGRSQTLTTQHRVSKTHALMSALLTLIINSLPIGGLDFGPVINQGFTFNAVTTTAVASVNVIDDDLFEPLEVFNGVLTASALPSNVLLSPSTALGEILEDAGNSSVM